MDQEPSRCLLITIRTLPPSFCLSYEYLYQYFSPYGILQNILIKSLVDDLVILVEYQNINSAINVFTSLQGQLITTWGGILSITYQSQKTDLESLNLFPKQDDLSQQLKDLKLGDFDFKDVFNDENEQHPDDEQQCNDDVKRSLEKFLDDEYDREQKQHSFSGKKQENVDQHAMNQYLQKIEKMNLQVQNGISRIYSDPVGLSAERNDEINNLLDDDDVSVKNHSTRQLETPIKQSIFKPENNKNPEIEFILNQQISKQLMVQNLDHQDLNATIIYNLFSNFGNISQVILNDNVAYIMYTQTEFASIAKDLLNNLMFFDQPLRIYYSSLNTEQLEDVTDSYIVPSHFYRFRAQKQIFINCPSAVLHISNLRRGIRQDTITKLFSQIGTVKGIR